MLNETKPSGRPSRASVARRSAPCTNCFLDQKDCRIAPNPGRGRPKKPSKTKSAPPRPRSSNGDDSYTAPRLGLRAIEEGLNSFSRVEKQTLTAPSPSTPATLVDLLRNCIDTPPDEDHGNTRGPDLADVHFMGYRFVETNFLFELRQDDTKYLENEGCFRLPRRDLVVEMLKLYFMHLHPLLPMLDESEFWSMVQTPKQGGHAHPSTTISLFLMQAMLFASCGFVSPKKLRWLGFASIRDARRTMYRRAKLLYSLDTDTDPLSLARGSLLLSLWSPRANIAQVDMMWLTAAIQYARSIRAHCCTSTQCARQHDLKRLWWSCIFRDRVLSLCLLQPIHITHDSFNFETGRLTVTDLQDAGELPGVYDKETKRVLQLLMVSLATLCTILTDALLFVYPANEPYLSQHHDKQPGNVERAGVIRDKLDAWVQETSYWLSLVQPSLRRNSSVIFFSDCIQMYFHSGMILLSNHEIHARVEFPYLAQPDQAWMPRIKTRLQDSISSITKIFHELVSQNLVKFLPMSAVTCAAQPLVLHLLDQTLIDQESLKAKECNNDLAIFLQAMKVYQSVYDITDHVQTAAYRISVEAKESMHDRAVAGWGDVLSNDPRAYLKFIVVIDLALESESFLRQSAVQLAYQPALRDTEISWHGNSEPHVVLREEGQNTPIPWSKPPAGGQIGCVLDLSPDAIVMPNTAEREETQIEYGDGFWF